MGLKKSVPLWGKTKDAKLRLLFPHISESIICDYLEGIFNGFSGSSISLVLTIFLFFYPSDIAIYYH